MKRLLLLGALAATACTSPPDPAFPMVGVLEGFYGPPWSHQDRLDVLAFMQRVGLTDYVYAPKDDPYHRQRWRDPYPLEQLAQLRELVDTARAGGLRFHFAISPGGSITYSDTTDYRVLGEKLASIAELGVDDFALFLDDVPPNLSQPADRERYTDLAAAHADLANRLAHDLATEGASLSLTPTTYTDAWGDRRYVRRLGQLTDTAVHFFWTGSDVVSPAITSTEARVWGELLGRRPLIWDNYPVNDFARWRPFLGPLDGRDPALAGAIAGLLSNPMNEAHASMLPLATLASFARNPASYDPARAIEAAALNLYGQRAVPHVLALVDVWGSYADEPNVFDPLFLPGRAIDSATVAQALTRTLAAIDSLRGLGEESVALRYLVDDLAPMATRTQERWSTILADDRFEHRTGSLEYRGEPDVVTVPALARAPTVDGRPERGARLAWRPLTHPVARSTVRAAFGRDDTWLYIFLDVQISIRRTQAGVRTGDADHVALILQHDTATNRQSLHPDDLLFLFPAPSEGLTSTVVVRSQRYDGFMAKYMADNQGMTFGEFHLATFGMLPETLPDVQFAARPTRAGYFAEIRMPLDQGGRQRLSLTVTTSESGARPTYGLATRNYPSNPATFAQLIWP